MKRRELSKRFETYSIREFCRKIGKNSILQFVFMPQKGDVETSDANFKGIVGKSGFNMDKLSELSAGDIVNYILGMFSEDKLIKLIQLGNYDCSEEEAAKYLDDYISNGEENSPITAFIALVGELERDRHYLATFGVNFDLIADQLMASVREAVSGFNFEGVFKKEIEEDKEPEKEPEEEIEA